MSHLVVTESASDEVFAAHALVSVVASYLEPGDEGASLLRFSETCKIFCAISNNDSLYLRPQVRKCHIVGI